MIVMIKMCLISVMKIVVIYNNNNDNNIDNDEYDDYTYNHEDKKNPFLTHPRVKTSTVFPWPEFRIRNATLRNSC